MNKKIVIARALPSLDISCDMNISSNFGGVLESIVKTMVKGIAVSF